MPSITRRSSLLVGAASLASCSFSPGRATLDVMALMTDGQAVVATLGQLLAIPAVAALLGPASALASAGLAAASSALVALHQALGPDMTVSVDTAEVRQIIAGLLAHAQTVLGLVTDAARTPDGIVAIYISAAQVLIPRLALAAALPTPVTATPAVRMTLQQAVAVAAHGAAR